ncbi:late competence development ComFB family protein [Bacillus sp. FJAT-47783]|uniref:late competence development ComFB family protein n=1 Tax=Bacillus sp. FJAT-47783 TaxID=2922712 RepID=UPI001FAD59AE|nr:late competence development ComFB family protein [Bacillus sp. FJAT-47783]
MVMNAMEEIMEELLDEYLEQLHMKCTCDICKEDVLALVLNKVQPHYVTEPSKVAYIKAQYVNNQELTSLIVKLAECAKIVSEHPFCQNKQEREIKN